MMPPDMDLQKHFANRRSLAEARAAYLTSTRNREQQSLENKREGIAPQIIGESSQESSRPWPGYQAQPETVSPTWGTMK
jgi:hypothetical protein